MFNSSASKPREKSVPQIQALKSHAESGELIQLVVYMRFGQSLKEKPLDGKLIEGRKEIHIDVLPEWSWSSTFSSTAA